MKPKIKLVDRIKEYEKRRANAEHYALLITIDVLNRCDLDLVEQSLTNREIDTIEKARRKCGPNDFKINILEMFRECDHRLEKLPAIRLSKTNQSLGRLWESSCLLL